MTRETAERVVQIYRNIETLKDIYKKLSDAHYVEIHASNESGIHTLCVECEKGKKNDKIVLHIINGIEKDIKNLEEELKTL